MKNKLLLSILIVFCLVSCNKTNKTLDVVETAETQKISAVRSSFDLSANWYRIWYKILTNTVKFSLSEFTWSKNV